MVIPGCPRYASFIELLASGRDTRCRKPPLAREPAFIASATAWARLIIELIERLRARGDIAIVMIAHNYAQTLETCDRVVLMQHGEITFESAAAATSAEELLEIVRREYRALRTG
jgi:simple sugar transport system ATP-binding protein